MLDKKDGPQSLSLKRQLPMTAVRVGNQGMRPGKKWMLASMELFMKKKGGKAKLSTDAHWTSILSVFVSMLVSLPAFRI